VPGAELDAFVDALATRIAKLNKWGITDTIRLVNTNLPPGCRVRRRVGCEALMPGGFHKPGDVENRLGC
jgi:hypothetical protein